MEHKKAFLKTYDKVVKLRDGNYEFNLLTKNNKKGLADQFGNLILKAEYEEIQMLPKIHLPNNGHYFIITQHKQRGVLLIGGHKVISVCLPIVFDEIEHVWDLYDSGTFEQHYFLVTQEHKKGVLNSNNETLIPIVHENLINAGFDGNPYSDDDNLYFLVEKKGKKGLMDRKNNMIIPAIYDWIEEPGDLFIGRPDKLFVRVKVGEKFGLYDMHEKLVLPAIYDTITALKIKSHRCCEAGFIVSRNGKSGVVNIDNIELIPIIYDHLEYLPVNSGYNIGHYFYATKGQHKGLLDIHGEAVIPLIYDGLKKIKTEDSDFIRFIVKKDDETKEIVFEANRSDWVNKKLS